MKLLTFISLMMVLVFPCNAETIKMKNLKAYDGDTIYTDIKVFENLAPLKIRVPGIDTPEMHGQCLYEKEHAKAAKAYINDLLKNAEVEVTPLHWDKYGGRFEANIKLPNGADLAQTMITNGYARKYDGGKKSSWCPK